MMLVCAMNTAAHARVNVRNYATAPGTRSQMIAAQQQLAAANTNVYATTTSATENLPVAVDDPNLERQILDNTSEMVSASDLADCSMIYPNGLFKWGVPESGVRRNQTSQCVAVIELRDANSNAVLAQTTLASGDVMKCNIDMFPQSGWQSALASVELPADEAPTVDDVEKVMDQEQKQNAGLKIAAGAILTGLAGNILAPKEAGDNRLLGTSKEQLVDTAIAATAGAGIMAASTYTGKVAGDTIKSTAVNAATGAVVANMAGGMAGGGDSTLTVKKCVIKEKTQGGTTHESGPFDCIAGNIDVISGESNGINNWQDADENVYFINSNRNLKQCKQNDDGDYSINGVMYSCVNYPSNLLKIQLSAFPEDSFENIRVSGEKRHTSDNIEKYILDGNEFVSETVGNISPEHYFKIYSASFSTGRTEHGYAVFPNGIPNKMFGYKIKDWDMLRIKNIVRYFARNGDGSVGPERKDEFDPETQQQTTEIIFTPLEIDAEDGALVDFSNKGRMKSTLTGAAAGGALGGFAGYQGAKQEVQERWVSASREYNDSLTNFYCATGTRYLSQYNDYIEIPQIKKFE